MARNLGLTREELEQTRRALEANSGNVRAAAASLGISRRAMQHRMAKLRKFTAPTLPSKSRDIDQLIADKIEESRRAKTADEARDLIRVPVHLDGPFGLLVLGDPHVDDAGCDFELLASHRDVAITHPYILAASVGDYQNGWIGRLGVLYGEQQVTAREAWKLVEWLVDPLQWLFLVGGNHDCLDMQTQALTRRGWVSYPDIRDDDQVMSLCPETGCWEWSPILSKIERGHEGEFVRMKGQPVDIRVTPNHRVLHRKWDVYRKKWNDLAYAEAGKMPAKFSIPVSASRKSAEYDIDDSWLVIAGWLLTDGGINWSNKDHPVVSFYQSKECMSLEAALEKLDLKHTVSVRNRDITHICGKELRAKPKPQRRYRMSADAARQILKYIPKKKELPAWAFDLSDRQFDVLLDAIVEGDGVWDGSDPSAKKCAVVHGELGLLESLQICAIQHGWRAHLSVARERDYRLNLSRKSEWQAHRYASVKREAGNERVWCLTVPKGNFMVRRNGKPYFTGNCWQGQGDPLEWIAGKQGSLYEPHGVRIELQHPCGAKTRIHARHDFPGTSIYSQLHGPRRELLMGFRDHLVICGHKHTGAQETLVTPDGLVAQIVRVSGYKVADSYAKQLGLKKHPIFPGALVIIDPREPETSPNRIWTAPTVERGVMFLDALRADYEKRADNVSKRKPAAGGSKRVSTGNT